MPPLRYLLAFVTAVLIIGGGVLFEASARQEFAQLVRTEFDKPENADFVTPEMRDELETGIMPHDVGMELPSSLLWKLQLAQLLSRYRLCFALMIIFGCFLIAWLAGGQKPQREG